MDKIIKIRTFAVRMADGSEIQQELLASFVGYVKNVGFRFVVLRAKSGRAYLFLRSARTAIVPVAVEEEGTWKAKGLAALAKIVSHAGGDKVFEVLSAAEKRHPQP